MIKMSGNAMCNYALYAIPECPNMTSPNYMPYRREVVNSQATAAGSPKLGDSLW